LAVDRLIKDFDSLRAVNNLSFGVKNRECFGLLGINGAGKTTTFRFSYKIFKYELIDKEHVGHQLGFIMTFSQFLPRMPQNIKCKCHRFLYDNK
jgi:ABC-type uncharacterized transport system ATPase subunit